VLTSLGVVCVVVTSLLSVLPAGAAEQEPKFPWMTRQGAILCQSYFSMKDAKAAVASGDSSWLKKTGCVQAVGGLKIILIDAPLGSADLLWKGRVYPSGEAAEGQNVYFDPYHILTYALVTAPLSDLQEAALGSFPIPRARLSCRCWGARIG
jgi:hypothetical protein